MSAVISSRVNLAEHVYLSLKTQIQDFALLAGERLSESDIGKKLGVSRTPVREALFRLREEGFLEVAPQQGWFVKPIDFAKVDQLYELRMLIEQACIDKLCAMETRTVDFGALKEIWMVRPEARIFDPRQIGALDEQFHSALVQGAGNQEFIRVHTDVTEKIRIVRRLDFTRPERIKATYSEHAQILRAVIQRRADQARLLLKNHIEQSRLEVRKITLHNLHEASRRFS